MRIQMLDRANGEKLSLTNDGHLEIFFLGVGAAASERNFQNNFLIIKGNQHLLVDLGSTGQRALKETAGLAVTDIEWVFPTHSHADHVGGIENMAQLNRYVGIPFLKRPKLKMLITEEYQRILWEHTLQGGLQHNEQAAETGRLMQLSDYFNILRPHWEVRQPREVFWYDLGPIHLEIFRTCHIPDMAPSWEASFISYGMTIDNRVFVSCDTKFDHDLIHMYSHSEVMFHDCQFFPGAVHAPLTDLRGESAEVKAKMYLNHYADNWEKQDISGFGGWTQQGVRYIFD